MAKNMIRKSLAIASAAALCVAGVAGLPANAAGLADTTRIALDPTSGASYNVLAVDGATLSLTANESVSIAGGDLSFLVTDADGVIFPTATSTGVAYAALGGTLTAASGDWSRLNGVVTVTYANTGTTAGLDVGEIINVAAGELVDTAGGDAETVVPAGYYTLTAVTENLGTDTLSFSFVDGVDDDAASGTVEQTTGDGTGITQSNILRDADDNSYVVDTGVSTQTTDEVLELTVNNSDAANGTVTTWVDDNNDGDIDSNEYVSPTVSVAFVAAEDLTATISMAAAFGDDSVSADVTFSPAINWDQAILDLAGTFDSSVTTQAFGTATETDVKGTVTVESTVTNANLPEGYLSLLLENADGDEIATKRIYVTDNDAATLEVEVDASNLVQSAANADVTAREDAGTVTVSITIEDSNGDAVAGLPVVVSDTGTSVLDSDATVTVGGEAVDVTDGSFDDVTVTTNASGVATVTISQSDLVATDHLDLTFTSENNLIHDLVFTWTAVGYTGAVSNILDAAPDADDPASAGGLNVATGGSQVVTVRVADQFGLAPSNGDYRVKAAVNYTDATATDVNKYGNVSGGSASVTITDSATVTLTLEAYDSDSASWGAVSVPDTSAAGSLVFAFDDAVVAEVTATNNETDDTVAASTGALEAVNTLLGEDAPDMTGAAGASITGAVTVLTTGAATSGLPVTISGSSNLLFATSDAADADLADALDVYAFGSLTGWSSSDLGTFAFEVFSNVAGEYEVTITSAGGSTTVDVIVAPALARVEDAALSIDVTGATAGRTMTVTGTLVDSFGNAVDTDQDVVDADFSVTYDGPGLVVGDLPSATDADGEFSFKVLLGINDVIMGSVTATYGGLDGTIVDAGNGEDDDNVSASVSLSSVVAVVATWTSNQNDGTVKMYAKNIVGAGKVQFMLNGEEIAWIRAATTADSKLRLAGAQGAAYLVRTVDLVEGQKNVLEIYVDGVRTTRSAYTY